MCLYLKKNPEFPRKRQTHKKYHFLVVHKLVQLLLDARANCLEGKTLSTAVENPLSRRSVSSATRLVGKHFPDKRDVRRKCFVCAYKIVPGTMERKNTRTF